MIKFIEGLIIGLVVGYVLGIEFNNYDNNNDIEIKLEQPDFLLQEELNDSILHIALMYYDIKYPKVVLSQAILESGHFKSKVFKEYNNLFGLYDSNSKDYYRFNHWSESILGYKNKVEYKFKGNSREDYYKFLLDLPYATDSSYIKKVKKIKSKYKEWN